VGEGRKWEEREGEREGVVMEERGEEMGR